MITLFGATGFTGRYTALYLRDHAPEGLSWAIAARSDAKLRAIRDELGARAGDVETIVADVSDPVTIEAMVARSKVVISTVGPYALYGTPVVDACVRHGVDYVDLTGETPWMRDMIDAYHGAAAARGTRIVPACGMDSVPSDIGAMFAARELRERTGQGCREVRCVFRVKGGVSGGTLASALNMGEAGETRRLADPVLLDREADRTAEARKQNRDQVAPRYDADLETWTAPFVMGPVNTRVVRRSQSLLRSWGEGYGDGFRYSESLRTSSRAMASAGAAGMGVLAALTASSVGRAVLRRVGPSPGQGPSPEALDAGFLDCRYVAVGDRGARLFARLRAQGDPGYKVTITMLAEAGLALAVDRESLPGGSARGGMLTPATALGAPYLERLCRAGISLDVERCDG
ncbi:MAG: saccharopine dehydrogenase NADP-binding domain-containing protein [Myxococcales bacterium]|nr:saccharopine dehydrogenase NADP-binding domain-containing protein [Myxococcales bacterium]